VASIKKRPDGTWRARYRDASGKEHSAHRQKKAEAQAWLDKQASALLTGTHVDPKAGRILFAEYVAEWEKTKADVAASTLANIRGRIRKHAKPFFDDMRMDAVRPTHARAYVAGLVADELAPSTVKGIVLTTAQVFSQAVDDGIIAKSPFAKVALPAERQREAMRFLEPAEVNTLAASITDRYKAAVYVAAYGGLRAGELWALRVDRVNILARTIDVRESMSETGGLHAGPTKTGKVRTIAIPRFLAVMLSEHIGQYSDEYVFTATEGGPVRHRNFRRRHFTPAAVKAGLGEYITDKKTKKKHYEGMRWHDLRHTCAALMIAKGTHIEEVKDHLGHSSIRVTSDRYGHLFPKARAALAERLDATYSENSADFSRTRPSIAHIR
jgi:integrase